MICDSTESHRCPADRSADLKMNARALSSHFEFARQSRTSVGFGVVGPGLSGVAELGRATTGACVDARAVACFARSTLLLIDVTQNPMKSRPPIAVRNASPAQPPQPEDPPFAAPNLAALIGRAHPGHDSAESETSFPQSGHLISAIPASLELCWTRCLWDLPA